MHRGSSTESNPRAIVSDSSGPMPLTGLTVVRMCSVSGSTSVSTQRSNSASPISTATYASQATPTMCYPIPLYCCDHRASCCRSRQLVHFPHDDREVRTSDPLRVMSSQFGQARGSSTSRGVNTRTYDRVAWESQFWQVGTVWQRNCISDDFSAGGEISSYDISTLTNYSVGPRYYDIDRGKYG